MKLNRRTALAGLGGLAVGGGVLLGSGAFSSVEAQRTVEVNVVTDTSIAEEFADVVLENVGANSGVGSPANPELGVGPEGNPTDPTTLFPTSGDSYGDSGYSPQDNDVSLIDNDVQIIYGVSGNELPPNSSVFYDGHFTVVNDSGTTAEPFEVTISTNNRGDLLQQQGNPPTNDLTTGQVSAGSTASLDARLNTGSSPDESDTLTISITQP
jgi:hypothetical protein